MKVKLLSVLLLTCLAMSAYAANVTLTISVNGQGTTVPAPGVYTYVKNTTVTVTAYPAQDWSFVNWTGSVTSTSNPISIKLSSNKTLIANFTYNGPPMYTLTTSVVGEGAVIPAGVTSYVSGTVVDVSAAAGEGYMFDHWEGALTGNTNPTTILMDGNKSVTGVFVVNPNDPATALANYVNAPDSNYTWSQYSSSLAFPYTNYFLNMTSQQWQTTEFVDRPIWTHYLIIQKPWFSSSTCVLLIDGGNNTDAPPTEANSDMGLLATITGLSIADLKMIPNQPLYFADEVNVARYEDDILGYSFDRAATSGDLSKIVLLPMVKAARRGMDTVQAKIGATQFIIAGGSKRGWTTWLLATMPDSRIKAICPIVIDILNLDVNVDHIWESYGFYPRAMDPYVAFDIFCRMKLPEAAPVKRVIDPYDYFSLGCYDNLPKLLVFSGGDQFFCQTADQFYLYDIPGSAPVSYRRVPNTSHDLHERPEVLEGVGYWCQNVKNGTANPTYTWTFQEDGSIRVQIGSPTPSTVRLWQVTNLAARDFRAEIIGYVWTSSTLYDQGGGVYVGYCPPPATGFTCFLVEMDYGSNKVFTTPARVTPDILPYAGTHCL